MMLLSVFLFFALSIIFSKVDITINNIEYQYTQQKNIYFKYNIKISLILFFFFKILTIYIEKDSFKINKLKLKTNINKNNAKKLLSTIISNRGFLIKNIQKIELIIKYSTYDAMLTALLFPMPFIFTDNYNNRNKLARKTSFSITPLFYNSNFLNIVLKASISFSIIKIIYFALYKKTNKRNNIEGRKII